MKKFFAILLALTMVLALAACGSTGSGDTTAAKDSTTAAPTDNTTAPADGTTAPEDTTAPADDVTVMTHAEYIAAAVDDPVVIETYVQATQSWWDNAIRVYAQSEDGAYFLYDMTCSEEDAPKLVPGTKIRVTGYKGEWSGEVEIVDATFEIIEGSFIAEPVDVTALLGTDELIDHQNEKVSFKGMTVEAANDNGDAFLYNWDGSGEVGNDLYFNVSLNGSTYTFCVESYLCGADTDVYKAVENLKVGDVIDLEGFLYWYNGPQPHITSVVVAG